MHGASMRLKKTELHEGMIFHLQQPILWPHQIQASVRWEKLQNQPSPWCWRSRRSEWSQLRRCSSSRVHRTVLGHQTAPSGRDTLSWARRGRRLPAEAASTREETTKRASSSSFLHAILICLTLVLLFKQLLISDSDATLLWLTCYYASGAIPADYVTVAAQLWPGTFPQCHVNSMQHSL